MIIYGNATPAWANLAGNTATTKKFLSQTGTGLVSAALVWSTILLADLPSGIITAVVNDTNVTGSVASATMTLGWTGTLAATRGGTGTGTYTLGDTLYSSASNVLSKLAGNTATTPKVLAQIGTGSVSAAPAWVGPLGSTYIDLTASWAWTGAHTFGSTFALTGDISPSQITSNQNDYSPTGLSTASTLRLTTDASRNITGLAGGADGRIIIIHNVGTNAIVLVDESSLSTDANRFALSADVTLNAAQETTT